MGVLGFTETLLEFAKDSVCFDVMCFGCSKHVRSQVHGVDFVRLGEQIALKDVSMMMV